ncbi:hypothetical protein K443DRAFT_336622 [Laccaria amethystina LaAM-08-1]|uniref:Uncharacterized protein n=1 Tax=Laccaria amethystina LaAM-08-1 TaxID=1095629 RepID=A0A0C9X0V5_9AGAR|nr:hypothetical protein K443DRAFT_336622 [Laccaria amethystina LaAM-08-1]
MRFVGCRCVSRDDTPQLIHAVQVPARLRMYSDGVTPQSGFWDFHSKVLSF